MERAVNLRNRWKGERIRVYVSSEQKTTLRLKASPSKAFELV
jgi:hypothetical protein